MKKLIFVLIIALVSCTKEDNNSTAKKEPVYLRVRQVVDGDTTLLFTDVIK